MSLPLQSISVIRNPTSHQLDFFSPNLFKHPKFHFPFSIPHPRLFTAAKFSASFEQPLYGAAQGRAKGDNISSSLDSLLSVFEFLSLASSAAASIYVAVRCGVQKGGGALGLLEGKILVWQFVVLVGGLVAGAVIRHQQWRRICAFGYLRWPATSGSNFLERLEKLEDDLRSSTKIVHGLARQLEKLGIQFRVTRKSLKEPIAETVALVQKNSEAMRALAAQEDNLEKELGEIQKVLLAMQEQQQKQLELILAIGKTGIRGVSRPGKSPEQKASDANKTPVDGMPTTEISQVKSSILQEESNMDQL